MISFISSKKSKVVRMEQAILQTMVDLNQNHDAVDYAAALLENEPENSDILTFLGIALETEGNSEQALKQYEKALLFNKNHPLALEKISHLYIQRTDLERSASYLKKLSKIKSSDPDVYHQLGLLAHMKNDSRKAVKYWKKSLKLDNRFLPAIHNLRLHNVIVENYVTLDDSLEESRIRDNRRQIEDKIKFLEVIEQIKNDPYEIFWGRKGLVYLHTENYKSYSYLDGQVSYRVLSKNEVKTLLRILLSLLVWSSDKKVDQIFWQMDYGRGQYYIYNRSAGALGSVTTYHEGRYQTRKTPNFLKFRINSELVFDELRLNGNIFLIKSEQDYHLFENIGTDIPYNIVDSLQPLK